MATLRNKKVTTQKQTTSNFKHTFMFSFSACHRWFSQKKMVVAIKTYIIYFLTPHSKLTGEFDGGDFEFISSTLGQVRIQNGEDLSWTVKYPLLIRAHSKDRMAWFQSPAWFDWIFTEFLPLYNETKRAGRCSSVQQVAKYNRL